MKLAIFALTIAATTVSIPLQSVAADDPILTRQALMKSVGAATKAAGAIVKGEAEYDAVTAELTMRVMHGAAVGFSHYFPEGSDTGHKNEASPEIWKDMTGFIAARDKFKDDSAAAIGNASKGADEFKQAFLSVVANCKSCHEKYRVKK
ncbi:c-type cytochrome [Coralliovum pocilloporae]|uniref:c-type cytochrome n=1 Tax=Coralliovum pocilloporae TaxID=3066369 RepID=UPI003306D68D